MQAYRYENKATGLVLENASIPEPNADQVLIAVEAVGLCHSDLHIISGRAKRITKKQTLGHEVAGTVVKLGSATSHLAQGDRVAVALILDGPGRQGWNKTIGLGYDGGYAAFATAYTSSVVKIPDNVSFGQAAVATDSIATAYCAVVGGAAASASMTIGILGLGGLGMNGVQIAALQGSKVYGIDIDEKKFKDAKHYGALECFTSLDFATGIAFDAIVDFAGVGTTTREAVAAVKPLGCVVLVGLGAENTTINTAVLVGRKITLKGSVSASLKDFETVLQLISSRRITPNLEEIPFSAVKEGLRRLHEGQVKGRLFTNPSKEPPKSLYKI